MYSQASNWYFPLRFSNVKILMDTTSSSLFTYNSWSYALLPSLSLAWSCSNKAFNEKNNLENKEAHHAFLLFCFFSFKQNMKHCSREKHFNHLKDIKTSIASLFWVDQLCSRQVCSNGAPGFSACASILLFVCHSLQQKSRALHGNTVCVCQFNLICWIFVCML